jgi:uncharacterized protein YndB with AHSA1/START domain
MAKIGGTVMSILIKIVVGLAVLVGLLALIGMLLPKQFRIERSIVIAAPAEKIYPLIADPRNWPKWGVWNRRDPNMKVEFSGAASGAGANWSWQSKSEGNGAMAFTAADPNRQITYQLTFVDFGMVSKGVLALAASGTGTQVRWTNEGEFGGNPFMRYFGLMMDRMVGKDFDAGLNNLKQLAEKN